MNLLVHVDPQLFSGFKSSGLELYACNKIVLHEYMWVQVWCQRKQHFFFSTLHVYIIYWQCITSPCRRRCQYINYTSLEKDYELKVLIVNGNFYISYQSNTESSLHPAIKKNNSENCFTLGPSYHVHDCICFNMQNILWSTLSLTTYRFCHLQKCTVIQAIPKLKLYLFHFDLDFCSTCLLVLIQSMITCTCTIDQSHDTTV